MVYDGFISYSHAADGKMAPALQRGLERLAKPWNSRRALHVFRDETGLSTNPHLWSAIEAALNGSGWFVLLASPESASSEWVNKEITHWVATKSVDRILPVVTDGIWEWDPATADFSADSSAVPNALRGVLHDEPRHLDLRWAREETDLDLRNSRFRGAVADLAAPMHDIPKDDLEGEDIRQHRRARRLARGGVAALAVLLVAALIATGFAVRARHQANVATDDALAGGLTAKVDPLLKSGNYDLALLLAVEANRAASQLPPSSSAVGGARDELVHSLAAEPALSRTLAGPQGIVSTVAYSPDGKTIVSQSTSGALRAWHAVTGAPFTHQLPPVAGTSTGLALNDAGLLVVTGAGTATHGTLETATDKNRLWDLANEPALAVAATPVSVWDACCPLQQRVAGHGDGGTDHRWIHRADEHDPDLERQHWTPCRLPSRRARLRRCADVRTRWLAARRRCDHRRRFRHRPRPDRRHHGNPRTRHRRP